MINYLHSFNSLCENVFNILSHCMNLSLGGFNAEHLLFFNWTMFALFAPLFLLSSSNIVNEILKLFVSNSIGVILTNCT